MPGPDGLQRVPPRCNAAGATFPVRLMRTYQIASPLATHWRPATCEEAGCEAYLNGWRTVVAVDSPQAAYIRSDRSRSWREARREGGLAEFTFPPGQQCFDWQSHRVPLERPEIYRIRGGDWRGNPDGVRTRLVTAQDWADDFGENQESLAHLIGKG